MDALTNKKFEVRRKIEQHMRKMRVYGRIETVLIGITIISIIRTVMISSPFVTNTTDIIMMSSAFLSTITLGIASAIAYHHANDVHHGFSNISSANIDNIAIIAQSAWRRMIHEYPREVINQGSQQPTIRRISH